MLRTYLATSRDGVHFDVGWAYAAAELIPHGRCRAPPGCASVFQLEVEAAAQHTPSLRWLDLRLNPLISDEGRQYCAAASVGASFDLKL